MPKKQNDALDELNSELDEAGETKISDPAEEDQEDADNDESENSSKESEEETDEDEEEEESESDDEEESEEEDDDESEADEEESEDEEDDEHVDSRRPSRGATVSWDKYKNEKSALREQRDYWKRKAQEVEQKKEVEARQQVDEQRKAKIKEMAESFGFDPAKTEKFANGLLELWQMPKEFQDKINALESKTEKFLTQNNVQAERSYFENEWSSFLPMLRKEYPNATDEQLSEAKEAMDIISHSSRDKLFQFPLDYVFWKTRDEFKDILFSPNRKTFERGRTSMTEREGTEKGKIKIPSSGEQTPDSMDALEQSLNDLASEESNSQGLTAYDDQGRKTRLRIE